MARFNFNPVWVDKSVTNDLVYAAGKGSIAAGDDVSFEGSNHTVGYGNVSVTGGNLDNSFNVSHSTSNSGNVTNTETVSNSGNTVNFKYTDNSTNDSYNDSSTNLELEIEDSFNEYTDSSTTTTNTSEVNIDESFNIDDSGNTSTESNSIDYDSTVTETTTTTESNWELEIRDAFNGNVFSGDDSWIFD